MKNPFSELLNATSRGPVKVRFLDFDCEIQQGQYQSGAMALQLIDNRTREDVATATVNVPGTGLKPNQVLIKDWSENEGILRALVDAGIVRPTGETVPCGFAVAHKCEVIHPRLVKKQGLEPARSRDL